MKSAAVRLIRSAVWLAVMYFALQLAVVLGVEKKSWLQMSWELVFGGSIGAIAGLTFFFLFGAIGWVCGAFYGAVGLVSLMVGGALGGLGLGVLANIFRNPQKYVFAWPTILLVVAIGLVVANVLSAVAGRFATRATTRLREE